MAFYYFCADVSSRVVILCFTRHFFRPAKNSFRYFTLKLTTFTRPVPASLNNKAVDNHLQIRQLKEDSLTRQISWKKHKPIAVPGNGLDQQSHLERALPLLLSCLKAAI